ncbi:Na+/H+ antiporter NhaC [Parendozoicomonas haliclonae]|uniref:Malate-2H(+)/Na(+)-lactate antiporter n=2 Tax=Parendozoicomonas haliclonae TaxID=1960125 RepID=A0A1X7ANZ8_9GAMM|nr:Malate-2H(+)/Na(+)-lactate antiporter [Parendozoicomonas haliclonae]
MRTAKPPTLLQTLLVLGLFLTMAFSFTTLLHLPVMLALFIGWFVIIGLGMYLGCTYRDLEEAAAFGIFEGMPALLILFAVGAMIGTWIVGGIVPGLIYYGLQLISPSFFLPTTLIICSITALATGTSWGAAGTAGIAMMGIGEGFGMDPALVAGAVLSGVYFGDKLSPLSDSVLLASSMSGVEIRSHIKAMLPISLSAYLITLVMFTIVGLNHSSGHTLEHIQTLTRLLNEYFVLSPLIFLPPLLVMGMLALRAPAFPVISLGALLGVGYAIYFQDTNLITALGSLWDIPAIETGHAFTDRLLNRGGILSIMPSVAMIIFGLGFGSLLVKVGIVQLLANHLQSYVTNESRLTNCTLLTAFLGNLLGSAMYVSLILTPKLLSETSDKLGADRRLLSRNTEFGGTLTSGMVPWSDNGTFMAGILGVSTLSYLPYMWLSFSCLAIAIAVSWYRTINHRTTQFDGDYALQQLQNNPLLHRRTTEND